MAIPYVTTEDSISFLIEGEVYMVTKDDDRYTELSKALEDGKDEETLREIYYQQFIKDAKELLSSLGQKKRDQ